MTLREFVHKIGFSVDESGLNKADLALQKLFQKTENLNKGFNKFAGKLESLGMKLTLGLTVPLGALATTSIMAATKMEELTKAWEVLTGDKESGKLFVQRMTKLSENTQFNKEEINGYSKELFKMKVPLNEILPRLKMYADIAAKTGVSMEELIPLQKGMNLGMIPPRMLRSLVMSGILDRRQLTQIFGTSDMRMILKMSQRPGGIKPEQIMSMMDMLGRKSKGASSDLANTSGKAFERFGEAIFKLRAAIGEMIIKNTHLIGILNKLVKLVDRLAELFEGMPPWIGKVTLGIGSLLFVLGPMVSMFGLLVKFIPFLVGQSGFGALAKVLGMSKLAFAGMLGEIGLVLGLIVALGLALNDLYTFFKEGPEHSLLGGLGFGLGKKLAQSKVGQAAYPAAELFNQTGLGLLYSKQQRQDFGAAAQNLGHQITVSIGNIFSPDASTPEGKKLIEEQHKQSAKNAYSQFMERFNRDISGSVTNPNVILSDFFK